MHPVLVAMRLASFVKALYSKKERIGAHEGANSKSLSAVAESSKGELHKDAKRKSMSRQMSLIGDDDCDMGRSLSCDSYQQVCPVTGSEPASIKESSLGNEVDANSLVQTFRSMANKSNATVQAENNDDLMKFISRLGSVLDAWKASPQKANRMVPQSPSNAGKCIRTEKFIDNENDNVSGKRRHSNTSPAR